MSNSKGRIIVEAAYAQGKMLDNSAWSERLARRITPSDIDFVVESESCFIFAEFSRDTSTLEGLKKGQNLLYKRLWQHTRTLPWIIAICQHNVPVDRQIDTLNDVINCTVYFDGCKSLAITNLEWASLVTSWSNNPKETLLRLNEKHELFQLLGF